LSKIVDKFFEYLFSDISTIFILPIVIGVVIIAFPTVIEDFLATIHISLPGWLWGGPEVPLQYILTVGTAEGLLTCGVPIVLGLTWNKWAGGASGFLCSVLFTLSMGVYYGTGVFAPTADWIGVIVSGMLVGYMAGALMNRFRMRGSTSFKTMLIASIVPVIVAIIITTQTYIWFSPMFLMSVDGMTYLDSVSFAYFVYIAIYIVWGVLAVIVAKVASWYK
jgi:hypothetical protein